MFLALVLLFLCLPFFESHRIGRADTKGDGLLPHSVNPPAQGFSSSVKEHVSDEHSRTPKDLSAHLLRIENLSRLLQDTVKAQQAFQTDYQHQQDVFTEFSSNGNSRFASVNSGKTGNDYQGRFAQVDPKQIWRGLYDTQPLRGPPPLYVNVNDNENTEKIREEANLDGMEAQSYRLLQTVQEGIEQMATAGETDKLESTVQHQASALMSSLADEGRKAAITTKEKSEHVIPHVQSSSTALLSSIKKVMGLPVAPPIRPSTESNLNKKKSFPSFRSKNEPQVDETNNQTATVFNSLTVVGPDVKTTVSDGDAREARDDVPAGYYGSSKVEI